jgi:hypothetical protein
MKMDDKTPVATKAQKDTFVNQWKTALAEAKLTSTQLTKIKGILTDTSKKMADNFMSLSDYRTKQKQASGDEAAELKKRVDLKENERDVIVSQTQIALKGFLNKDQINLVMMAGFHGTSLSMSGSNHSADMKGQNMNQSKLDQMTMDLGKLAEKINGNCEAVTLGLVLKNL